jgi:hypothetical protein
MDRPGHDKISFFIGTEVEHSPAFGRRKLFVVGVQDSQIIMQEAANNDCDHIYFGANQSFPQYDMDADEMQDWEMMIVDCLEHGWLSTLDFDVYNVDQVTQSRLPEFNNFIPMISVKLPYVQLLGYNATLKIDDKDFAATNPGVWCHSIHELRNRKTFTDWSKYTKDEVIK